MLYYLQSRYYDPGMGRFINADAYTSTGQGVLGNNMFAYCGNNPVNRCDPSGHLWRILLITTIFAVTFSACGTNDPGVAPDYVEIGESDGDRSKNPNCYAYAIGYYDQSYNPGDFSTPFQGLDVEDVADAVIRDMEALGRGVRVIDGCNAPINENEYRIALRVSQPKLIPTQQGFYVDWDYHFMVQTSDGNWAEKHGPGGATVYHHTGTPDTISWDLGTTRGYYTSNIIYFAVTGVQ
mgnify:CR=1 FL=1